MELQSMPTDSRGQAPTLARCCAVAVQGVVGAVRPRRPDLRFLAGIEDRGLPEGATTARIRVLPQVPRRLPAAVVEGMRGPAIENAMTGFVLEHPQAKILLDPGICARVGERVVPQLPRPLRGLVQPGPDVVPTLESLRRAGIDPASIDVALPTHLHWDHVCGLLDLPGLPLWAHRQDWAWMATGERAPAGGVRDALRGRAVTGFELDGPPVLTFLRSHDFFGDGAVVAVDLAGHTPGSVGILVRTAAGPVLLAGDAVWSGVQVRRLRQKAAFPGAFADIDRDETFKTLHRLHALPDRVRVVPTHDYAATSALAG